MKTIRREQSDGLLRVAVLLMTSRRYVQASDCIAIARLVDPSNRDVERTWRALAGVD